MSRSTRGVHRGCVRAAPAGQRGGIASRVVGLLALAVGVSLLTGPWWSSTLPASDRPLVLALGTIFAGIGAYATIPDRFPRAQTAAFALFMGAFGLACAALALSQTAADGTTVVAGVPGLVTRGPLPVWARLVAGFFALVCLGVSGLGFWGLVRGDRTGEPTEPD